jgi:hypothetical protein
MNTGWKQRMNTARTYISEDEEQKNGDDALVFVPKDDRTPGADNVTQNVLDMRISRESSMIHGAYHYASDDCDGNNSDIGFRNGPYPATCWVKECVHLLEVNHSPQHESDEAQDKHEGRDRQHEYSGWR